EEEVAFKSFPKRSAFRKVLAGKWACLPKRLSRPYFGRSPIFRNDIFCFANARKILRQTPFAAGFVIVASERNSERAFCEPISRPPPPLTRPRGRNPNRNRFAKRSLRIPF